MLIGSYPQQGLPHSTHLTVPALSYPRDQTAKPSQPRSSWRVELTYFMDKKEKMTIACVEVCWYTIR